MKGIVADIKDKKAVLISDSGEFYTIPNKGYEIGEEIEYKNQSYRSIVSIAACFLFLMLSTVSGYSIYFTPTAYVSIDINPSIQFDINRFSRVIEVHPLNDDAKKLLNDINVKNAKISDALKKVVEASEKMGFLNESNNQVEIDVLSLNNSMIEEINNGIKDYKPVEVDVNVGKANDADKALSNELGVSIGRAKAIREYTEFFGGETKENAEKLSGLSMGEVKNMKNELKNKEKNSDKKEKMSENIKKDKINENSSGNANNDKAADDNKGNNLNNAKKENDIKEKKPEKIKNDKTNDNKNKDKQKNNK